VRVLRLAALAHRPIEAHGSRGFAIGAFGLTAEASLVTVSLRPGGVIGRHAADARQLLVVLTGDAVVAGSDRVAHALGPGEAAVWEPGEDHETRSDGGLTALMVQGDLDLSDPGHQVDPGDV
jgi:quercetin dioxygenase-like cupin family protein